MDWLWLFGIGLFMLVVWAAKTRRSKVSTSDSSYSAQDTYRGASPITSFTPTNAARTLPPVIQSQENKPVKVDQSTDGELAFIDLETTGLDPQGDRIIEVGVFIIKKGNQKHKGYSELVQPDRKLPVRIVEITGITDEMLADARKAGEVLPEFFDYIGNRDVCAYNAEFDMGFLKAEAKRLGCEFNNRSFCVMEYFKEEFPQLRSYSLDAVCKDFDISTDKRTHRALADSERTALVYFAACSGKTPVVSSDGYGRDNSANHYYVYGHYTLDEKLFYVGVGHDDRAWSTDRQELWHYYVDNHLFGKYDVKLIHEKLTSDRASELKGQLMARHVDTLVNWQNPNRDSDYRASERFHKLRDANRALINTASMLEKTAPDAAIQLLKEAIEKLDEYSFLKLEGGFVGQLLTEQKETQGYKGELDALDRLTLLLCKQGRALEAKQITDQYFAKFRADERLKKAEATHKRVNKAVAKLISSQAAEIPRVKSADKVARTITSDS